MSLTLGASGMGVGVEAFGSPRATEGPENVSNDVGDIEALKGPGVALDGPGVASGLTSSSPIFLRFVF